MNGTRIFTGMAVLCFAVHSGCTCSDAAMQLSADVSPDGGGSVTSDPAALQCPGTCSAEFRAGTTVTLIATPSTNHTFSRWTGDCDGTAGRISVAVQGAAKSCHASFARLQVAIAAEVSSDRGGIGTGGSVTSDPNGINCASSGPCSASFDKGSTVQLTAVPVDATFQFSKWSNCSTASSNPLIVDADAAKTCRANFTKILWPIAADVYPNGFGTVQSNPSGINCTASGAASCVASFDSGSSVTLSAVPDAVNPNHRQFLKWVGSAVCDGKTDATITVTATTPSVGCAANFWGNWAKSYGGSDSGGVRRTAFPAAVATLNGDRFAQISSESTSLPDGGTSLPDGGVMPMTTWVSVLDAVGRNQQTFDIAAGVRLSAADAAKTADQGLVIVASQQDRLDGGVGVALVKVDQNGTLAGAPREVLGWSGSNFANSAVSSIISMADGGFGIAGSVSSMADRGVDISRVTRASSDGTVAWDSKFCFRNGEGCASAPCVSGTNVTSIAEAPGGGVLSVGNIQGLGCEIRPCTGALITRLERDGTMRWQQIVSTSLGSISASSVIPSFEGGYLIAGTFQRSGSTADLLLLWIPDSPNSISRVRSYRATAADLGNVPGRVIATGTNKYVVVGAIFRREPSGLKLWVLQLNGAGDPSFSAYYGGAGSEVGLQALAVARGGFLFSGATSSFEANLLDKWLLRTDDQGQITFNVNPTATRTVATLASTTLPSMTVSPTSCHRVDTTLPTRRDLAVTSTNVTANVHTQAN